MLCNHHKTDTIYCDLTIDEEKVFCYNRVISKQTNLLVGSKRVFRFTKHNIWIRYDLKSWLKILADRKEWNNV